MMVMMMIMVNLWYSKILLEIGGTDYIAGFPENPTRCWGSQKCHHVPWWRNGRFHGNRRSYSQGSTTEQNRGGNCSVVGEIPQCGSIKGNSVNVNHEPNYNDRFFPPVWIIHTSRGQGHTRDMFKKSSKCLGHQDDILLCGIFYIYYFIAFKFFPWTVRLIS